MIFHEHTRGVHNNDAFEVHSLNDLQNALNEAKQKNMVVVAMGGKSIKIVPKWNFFEKITAFFSGEMHKEHRQLKNLRISLGGAGQNTKVQQLHPAKGITPGSSTAKLFQDTFDFLANDIRGEGQHQKLLRAIKLGRTPEADQVKNSVGLNHGYVSDPENKHKSDSGYGPLRTINLEIGNLLAAKQTLDSLCNVNNIPENNNLKAKLEPLFAATNQLGQTKLIGVDGFKPKGTGDTDEFRKILDQLPKNEILDCLSDVAIILKQINDTFIKIIDSDRLSAQNTSDIESQLAQINSAIEGLDLSKTPSEQQSIANVEPVESQDTQEDPIELEDIQIQVQEPLETPSPSQPTPVAAHKTT